MTELVEELRISPQLSAKVGRQVRLAMRQAQPRVLQADVAAWLGLSQGAVWKRLEGETQWTVGELVVVAEHLGIPVDVEPVESAVAQLVDALLDGISEKVAA